MKKNYVIIFVFLLSISINNLLSQGNTCPQATPFCTAIGTPFTFPNVHNGSNGPTGVNYGCLCQADADNPSWFYVKSTSAGVMTFNIRQVNNGGTGTDVDFVAWGPYSSMTNVCSNLTGSCSGGSGSQTCGAGGGSWANQTCVGNIADCESSPSSIENMALNATAAGQYFVIMVTNYEGDAGNITITQTGGPATDCSITCPTVLSGPGIVNIPSTNAINGVAATPLPTSVSCTTGLIDMYASNVTPFGNPVTPGVFINTYVNNRANNTIWWYENGMLAANASTLTANTTSQLQVSYMSPSAVNTFSFCEVQNGTDMPSNIMDLSTGAVISNYNWVANSACSGYLLPAGSVKGITSWTSSCGACLTGVTDWGYAQFNPGAAGIGTHTITYSFNPQSTCPTFTTSVIITVTNPFNATFTPPGPLCVNAACAVLTPANTYTVGSGSWSGTGVSGNSFCPSSAGTGTIPVTYTVGTTATCRATYAANVVVNPVPTVTATASNSGIACSGSSINLSSGGAVTYTWNPGGSNSSAITVTPAVSPTNYTVQGTNAEGCRNQAVVSVTISPTPTVNVTNPASTNTSTICVGGNTILSANGASSYTWSPAAGLSNTNGSSVTASPTITTVYTIVGSSSGGCNTTASSQGSFTVYVNPIPTIGITPANSGTVCSGSTISLTGTGAGAGGSYVWTSGAGGGLSSTSGTNVNITPTSSPVTYTVIGTSVGGCTNTAQTTVTVLTTPTVTVTNPLTTNSSTICSGNSVVLTATGASSFTWSPATGLSSTTGGVVTASPTNTTTPTIYTVTGTSVGGCVSPASSQGTFTVTVNPTPVIGITPANSGTVCSGSTISLTGTGAGAGGSYVWTSGAGGGLGSTSGTNVNITPTSSPVTYTVIGTSVGGCTNTAQTTVTVLTTPTVTVTNPLTTNSSTICSGNSVVLTANGASSFTWSPATGLSSTTGGAVTASPTNTTTPTIYTVTGTSVGGCVSPASSQGTFTVTVNPTPTVTAVSGVNSTSVCAGTTVPSISFSVNPAGSVNWTNNNTAIGLAASGSGNSTPAFTAANVASSTTGILTVTATATNGGCSTTASSDLNYTITVHPLPSASIAVTTLSTTCSNPTVTLNATSNPATGVNYNWTAPSSGSLNSYTISNPIASGSGIFTVTVTNSVTGCSAAVSQATVQVIPDAATPAVFATPNTLTLTCTTTTVTSAITSTNSITGYAWSPTPVTGGANPVFNSPGIYNATVTASNGCSSNISISVISNTTSPSVSLSTGASNGTITCTNTFVTISPTVTPSTNLTYTWSPSGVTSSTINDATFTAAGVYTLAVTNTITGCVTSLTNTANTFTVIADNTTPTVTLSTAPTVTTTCALPNATLSASSNADPNTNYTWLTPVSTTLTGNPVTTSAPGIYTLVVTNTVNGCATSATSPSTVEVVVDAGIPVVTLSSSTTSITCSNPTPSVSISTTATPVSYSWTPTSGIVPGTETTANPVFNAPGTYSVVVTNTISGCATSVNGNVVTVTLDNIPPVILPFLGAINSGTINCNNPSVTATPVISPSSADLTYTWSPVGTGLSTPPNQPIATFTAAGIYTLSVTNTVTGCVSTTTNSANTFTVELQDTPPTATITAVSSNSIIGCGASSSTVTLGAAVSNTNTVITWLPSNTSSPTLDVTTAGVYTLQAVDAVNGCSVTTTYTVVGNTTPPQNVDAGTNVTMACGSTTVSLNGTSTTTNVSYAWAGPSSSSIISGANTANPDVNETGIYTLTVTDNLTGCVTTATVNVVQGNVTAAFTADPTQGLSPLTVNFTDASIGATTYNWSFGDGNVSSSQNPSNIFVNAGSYNVTLIASTGICTDTFGVVIIVSDGLTLEIPNVFTPNNDGFNDIFTIKSTGIKEISLQVFNRWGIKLYEFAGPKASWDGSTPQGMKVPEGTYFYFVKATGYDDKVIEKNGTVNLFR